MKRTMAAQLVLVNWRGVFYERYLLDQRVTVLEGANGAGKTTVMVAAYVVLLPDQRYLRFEPLAEGGSRAEDRGVWGRLGTGEAYSAIDFTLGTGDRLLAGVRFERRGKDNGNLHPFLVRGLPTEASLQHIFLDRIGDEDEVPAPSRLAELAAMAGGRLNWCDSVSSYLTDLFDAGVMPMPMSTAGERDKLNELLRTSMLGGISEKLGDGLRSFLLRPEEGLGRSLNRIQANLDECRRTRRQLEESRRLEQEIHEVLDAGVRMFAAAIEGERRFADERRKQLEAARSARDAAQAEHRRKVEEWERASEILQRAEVAEHQGRDVWETARETARNTKKASQIWSDLRVEEERLECLCQKEIACEVCHREAATRLGEYEATVHRRETDYQQAAQGMADVQAGLERLHAHAARYRVVHAALGRAQAALLDLEFTERDASAVLARCKTEAATASKRLAKAQGQLETCEARAHAFRRVQSALERISGDAVDPSAAHSLALESLRNLRASDERVRALPDLRARKERSTETAARQRRARAKAAALAARDEPLNSGEDVTRARGRCLVALDGAQQAWFKAAAQHDRHSGDLQREQAVIESLTEKAAEYQHLRAVVVALGARWEAALNSSEQFVELSGSLRMTAAAAQQRAEVLAAEVDRVTRQLQDVRNAGGSFPKHLAEACATVDGRLLVERFEDAPFERAGEVQARLGPWVNAILVDDVDQARDVLEPIATRPDEVWLLDGRRLELDLDHLPPAVVRGDAVATPVEHGLRLTRISANPVVGRQARERVIETLEQTLVDVENDLSEARDLARRATSDAELIAPLLIRATLLDGPDPAIDLAAAEVRAERLRVACEEAEAQMAASTESQGLLRERALDLDELWQMASLLDPPDFASEVERLQRTIDDSVRDERHLTHVASDRKVLEDELDVLRALPLDGAAREALKREVSEITATRERWSTPQLYLEQVCDDLEAFDFADAQNKLRAEEDLLPSLTGEAEAAESRLRDARQARDEAKGVEVEAEEAVRVARAERLACHKRTEDKRSQFAETGVRDASAQAVQAAEGEEARAQIEHEAAAKHRREADRKLAALAPQVDAAKHAVTEKENLLASEEAQAVPAMLRWNRLKAQCAELGLLHAALSDASLRGVEGTASIQVFELRKRAWVEMLERLRRASDGAELASELDHRSETTEPGGQLYLDAWLLVRQWLARRVPKHVSEVEDPVDALRRLRGHLDRLVDQLGRFEHRLKGDSQDIARAVEGRLRKVSNLLTRLNQDLRGVGFGSIEAIRIESKRDEGMANILRALAAPEGQLNLFSDEQTIEEALHDLFFRHRGRRDSGERILDYREYTRLWVEVRRRGSESWELARKQMSTGELIGVGAAIMMVILATWEREAKLLRPRQQVGTLRFLFLDEASRLSPDNLEVLFDLCGALDLQLLAAAPEVETSSGNTTYLLQRSTDAEGREVVRVSGRRARLSAQ